MLTHIYKKRGSVFTPTYPQIYLVCILSSPLFTWTCLQNLPHSIHLSFPLITLTQCLQQEERKLNQNNSSSRISSALITFIYLLLLLLPPLLPPHLPQCPRLPLWKRRKVLDHLILILKVCMQDLSRKRKLPL